jgi:hypothetical protein
MTNIELSNHSFYLSSISSQATEHVLARYPSGVKQRAEYCRGETVVGFRSFYETGELQNESSIQNGVSHGVQYRWDELGFLISAEPYEAGLAHGIAKQWHQGQLIGSYTMVYGTGLDLWWQSSDRLIWLSEARYYRDGYRDGFEWWINHDQCSIYQECHFQKGLSHGIEREWNLKGRLRRGFPKYWINDQQVTKRQYLAACKLDPTLPPFRESDNNSQFGSSGPSQSKRQLPPEVLAALGPRPLNPE